MKIGVWLIPDFSPEEGGGYSYYSRLITGIDNYSFSDEIELYYIIESTSTYHLNRPKIHLSYIPDSLKIRERLLLMLPFFRGRIKRIIEHRNKQKKIDEYTKVLQSNNIKILFYPIPYLCPLPNFPFIITHWDIGHRSTYAFPELSSKADFVGRESYYNKIIPRALSIFCESEAGKKELIQYSHITPLRVKIVPIFASDDSIKKIPLNKQELILHSLSINNNHYFFYPAQFWAHKNHYNLLKAFQSFCKDYPDYKLVFTGSDHGNKAYIEKCINSMNLSNNVMILGFVSDDIISTLYRNATALVMPTLMGPTNMPPLEAMALGCPVICSDMPGHREELGDAAIYIAPLKPETIDSAMREIHTNRSTYVEKIEQQREVSSFNIENALACINKHFVEIESIRNCWE